MAVDGNEGITKLLLYFITTILSLTGLVIFYLLKAKRDDPEEDNTIEETYETVRKPAQQQTAPKTSKKKLNWKQGGGFQFSHPHLLSNLKGHSGQITSGDFSSNGKHFISSSEDRTVLIWATKDFGQKDLRSARGNIDLDHATNVCWSPDSKAFIVHKATANVIEVYKISKKSDGSFGNIQPSSAFPQHESTMDIIYLGIAVTGKFIVTCDSKNQLMIWDLHGEVLGTLDTRHGDTYSASLSPCGRFVATTGFTPDIKVWEIRFSKTGAFEGIKRAFELKGHKSGIYSCGFNQDSTRMVSLSKDGTWRLYDTNIEFDKGQEPYLLLSGEYETKDKKGIIRLSPDGRTIALAYGHDLLFFSAITGEKLHCINEMFSGPIIDVKFDPSSKYVLTLGDKHTRVFHNVAGYETSIQDLERSLKNCNNSGMRERIIVQIKDAKTALKGIQEKMNDTKY